jgi:hypothetical protein
MRLVAIVALLALCLLGMVALIPGETLQAEPGSAAHTTSKGIYAADTPEPERVRPYRSYPAPTGLPAFRKYYQKRCYPGCHYGQPVVTPSVEKDAEPTPTPEATRVRVYRSYPAPTGLPGFRKYYQRRCYPGCHYGQPVITPIPNQVHP